MQIFPKVQLLLHEILVLLYLEMLNINYDLINIFMVISTSYSLFC